MIDQYPPSNGVLTSLIWRKTATGGETSLSGYDDASQALSYTPGQEQVYLNGVLLVRGDDYTAINGTSITDLGALSEDDFVQINCYNNFSVASVPATSITGNIANNQLQNSSITINGTPVSLGSSVSLPGDIESVTASSPLTGGGTSGAVTIGIQSASTSQAGAVQLTDSTASTSITTAATPNSVKSAYDLADSKASTILSTNAQTASYALVLGDAYKIVEMNVSSGNTLTIPTNAQHSFPVGTQITVIQTGAGQTTIAGTSGVTVNSNGGKLKIVDQWGSATLIKRATDTWIAIGNLTA